MDLLLRVLHTILFLGSFEVYGALEPIDVNIILRFWRNLKALQNFLFEDGVFLSLLTKHYLDLKCNDFFGNSLHI